MPHRFMYFLRSALAEFNSDRFGVDMETTQEQHAEYKEGVTYQVCVSCKTLKDYDNDLNLCMNCGTGFCAKCPPSCICGACGTAAQRS